MKTLKNLNLASTLYALMISALFIPVKYKSIFGYETDYKSHIALARLWYDSHHFFGAPHFLFQLLTIIVKYIGHTSWDYAGFAVDLAFYFFAAKLILSAVEKENQQAAVNILITTALLLSWPLFALCFLDNRVYSGYIGTNVFHNPTIVVLKPLALYIHLKIATALDTGHWKYNWRQSTMISVMVVLASLAKPNYTIVFLPALAIYFLSHAGFRHRALWTKIIGYAILPAVAILVAQFCIRFGKLGSSQGPSKIIFAPFMVQNYHSKYLLGKFLLSIAFPLSVLSLYFRTIWNDKTMQFAWICFSIGVFYTYFLAEMPDMASGNFGWCSQISLFILFIQSSLFLLKNWRIKGIVGLIPFIILVLHAAFGIFAYLHADGIS